MSNIFDNVKPDPEKNKRKCYGTHEFNQSSSICNNCESYKECKAIAPPLRGRRKRMLKDIKSL